MNHNRFRSPSFDTCLRRAISKLETAVSKIDGAAADLAYSKELRTLIKRRARSVDRLRATLQSTFNDPP